MFKAGTALTKVTDGTSKTLLLSEGLVTRVNLILAWADRSARHGTENMGGSLFSATLTPNSTTADRVRGPCPDDPSVADAT